MEDEVKDTVNSKRDMITATMDFEDFKSVSLEKRGTPIPDDNATLLFKDLQNRAKGEEEKAAKDDIVGFFSAAKDVEELRLILAEEKK